MNALRVMQKTIVRNKLSKATPADCLSTTVNSRRFPDTLHSVACTGCAGSLTARSPIVDADGHKANFYGLDSSYAFLPNHPSIGLTVTKKLKPSPTGLWRESVGRRKLHDLPKACHALIKTLRSGE